VRETQKPAAFHAEPRARADLGTERASWATAENMLAVPGSGKMPSWFRRRRHGQEAICVVVKRPIPDPVVW